MGEEHVSARNLAGWYNVMTEHKGESQPSLISAEKYAQEGKPAMPMAQLSYCR